LKLVYQPLITKQYRNRYLFSTALNISQ
jgi:hypothetical protein